MHFMSRILLRCKWPFGPFAFNKLNLRFLRKMTVVHGQYSAQQYLFLRTMHYYALRLYALLYSQVHKLCLLAVVLGAKGVGRSDTVTRRWMD